MSSSQRPILYSFRRCPYAMRARLAVAYAGIEVELREIVLRDKPAQLLKASSKGTVPVLVLPDGQVIDESYDIMRWAINAVPDCDWRAQETNSDVWVNRNDNEFKPWLDRYKYADRYPEQTQLYYRDRCEQWFLEIDARLKQQGGYLFGCHMTLADAAILPFIRQCAHVDRNWFYSTRYATLHQWLDQFLHSKLFIHVMKKNEKWSPAQSPIIFGPCF